MDDLDLHETAGQEKLKSKASFGNFSGTDESGSCENTEAEAKTYFKNRCCDFANFTKTDETGSGENDKVLKGEQHKPELYFLQNR